MSKKEKKKQASNREGKQSISVGIFYIHNADRSGFEIEEIYRREILFFFYYSNICLSDGKQLTIREKQVRLSISLWQNRERTSFMEVDCIRAPRIESLGERSFSLSVLFFKIYPLSFSSLRFCRDEKVQRKETRHATLSKASDGMRTTRSNGGKKGKIKQVLLPPFNANMQVDKLFSFLFLFFFYVYPSCLHALILARLLNYLPLYTPNVYSPDRLSGRYTTRTVRPTIGPSVPSVVQLGCRSALASCD